MSGKSKKYDNKPDFSILIPGYSDAQIIDILKKRNHYLPDAAYLAVKEAIRRGIIHSEQDLFSDEFRLKPLKSSIFPIIEDEIQRKKISKSISRGLIIAGTIPMIYGVIQILESNFGEGILLAIGGICWLVLATQMLHNVKRRMIIILFVLLAISLLYIGNLFLERKSFVWMDFFVPVSFYFLVTYGLLFLRKINS